MNPISTANKTGELKAAYQRPMESPFQDQAFEDFAHLASSVSGAPIAVISFAMGSRQRFSTVVGLSGPEPSLISIFRDVIACQTDPLIVPDTLADARFAESLPHSGAIVGETPHVRFYAGVPLINSEGIVIGELSVMDTRPRNISARRIDALCRLGRHVVEMIEMRRRVYDLEFTVNKRKKATSMLEARNRDLTAQKSALEDQAQSLRRSTDDMLEGNALYAYASRRFLELFQGLPVACYCYDSRGRVFEWNRAFELLYGRTAVDILLRTIWDVVCQPQDVQRTIDSVDAVFAGESIEGLERDDMRADGSTCRVLCNTFPIRRPDGIIVGGISANLDISARVRAEQDLRQSELRFRSVAQSATDAIIITDGIDQVVFWNQGARSIFGYEQEEALGRCLADLLPDVYERPPAAEPGVYPSPQAPLPSTERRGHDKAGLLGRTIELIGVRKDGKSLPVEVSMASWSTDQGVFCSGIIRDITERKQYEQQLNEQMEQINNYSAELEINKQRLELINKKLESLAKLDGMTGLRNHRAFQERLAAEFQRAVRYAMPLSLVLLDVDHFKQYNDSFGHPAGDEVLKLVAATLQANARGVDLVARYGGEEFTVILPHTEREGALILAERFRDAIEHAAWPSRATTASFGVVTLAEGMVDSLDLIEEADKALYASKSRGRNRVTHALDIIADTHSTPMPLAA